MSRERTATERSGGHLRAVFTIEPHPETNCAVLASGSRGENVSQAIVCRDGTCERGCQCRSAVTLANSGDRQFVGGAVRDRCICPVFRSHDCIASIERFEAGTLEVELTVPDRSELETIVAALRETGASVRLRRLTAPSSESDGQRLKLDLNGITDKQRETALTAVKSGYYETPRRTDLDELADRLDVSKSAVSQRLSAVESTLVTSLVDRDPGG
ncbi:helix-turn-helix domain-containing protein [Halosolutus halophilus]|uniref:helix-turn-helix domain-containing protein n=1 Tax=Halosolutus halophilus TaxID=1552990 RepID=UPI002234F6C1|nr:helix-turn-helix domain-containing protein [Halosolutus halophilus]